MKPHLDQDRRSCLLTQASQKDLPPASDRGAPQETCPLTPPAWRATHCNEEEHHAAEREAAGVTQVACKVGEGL